MPPIRSGNARCIWHDNKVIIIIIIIIIIVFIIVIIIIIIIISLLYVLPKYKSSACGRSGKRGGGGETKS